MSNRPLWKGRPSRKRRCAACKISYPAAWLFADECYPSYDTNALRLQRDQSMLPDAPHDHRKFLLAPNPLDKPDFSG